MLLAADADQGRLGLDHCTQESGGGAVATPGEAVVAGTSGLDTTDRLITLVTPVVPVAPAEVRHV